MKLSWIPWGVGLKLAINLTNSSKLQSYKIYFNTMFGFKKLMKNVREKIKNKFKGNILFLYIILN